MVNIWDFCDVWLKYYLGWQHNCKVISKLDLFYDSYAEKLHCGSKSVTWHFQLWKANLIRFLDFIGFCEGTIFQVLSITWFMFGIKCV
jgi:hypothetical protein